MVRNYTVPIIYGISAFNEAYKFALLISAFAAGIAPEAKQDDYQHELPEDHQTAIKQSLVSSYRTNLYPSLKAEIQTEPQSHSPSFMSQ